MVVEYFVRFLIYNRNMLVHIVIFESFKMVKGLVCYLILVSLCFGGGVEWRWGQKNAVVTGASSGIGAKIAVALADLGMYVVGLGRNVDKIKDLSLKTKGTIHAVKCDITKEEDILKAFKYVGDTVGGVDVLINDAGVFLSGGFVNGSTANWRNSLEVNILGMAMVTREALKSMRQRDDDGHIININSVGGHKVLEHQPTGMYSPSKFAVTAFTEALRIEFRHLKNEIKVTSISPGAVKPVIKSSGDDHNYILGEDVVDAVIYALMTRPGVEVQELTIQPVGSSICPAVE